MEIAIVQTHRYPAITSTKAKFIRYSKQQKRVLALEYMHSAYTHSLCTPKSYYIKYNQTENEMEVSKEKRIHIKEPRICSKNVNY